MRFLLLIDTASAASADEAAMAAYNRQLVHAGVLLAGDLSAGFWLLEVDSAADALEWRRRLPCREGDVEIRAVRDEFRPCGGSTWAWAHLSTP